MLFTNEINFVQWNQVLMITEYYYFVRISSQPMPVLNLFSTFANEMLCRKTKAVCYFSVSESFI